MDHESFKTMAIYLLFSATYNEVPLATIIDMKVKESLEKSGSAKNAAFWNWTPLQKSILDADLPRVIMTSYWSTGKTRILFVKALTLARDGKFVIFVLHYSQVAEKNKDISLKEKVTNEDRSSITNERVEEATTLVEEAVTATVPDHRGFRKFLPKLSFFKKNSNEIPEKAVREDIKIHEKAVEEDNTIHDKAAKEDNEIIKEGEDFTQAEEEPFQTNFLDHAPILLYHSLMNEIDKESEKNPQVKANIKLMVSKDLEEDILEKNAFDNGGLV